MGDLVKIDYSVALKSNLDLDELIKPLSKEILLFSTKIAGIYKLQDKTPALALKKGDRLLFRRGSSKYEKNLVLILSEDMKEVGSIPEQDSVIFARLMDAGKSLFARVKEISLTHSMRMIDIDIYLEDF